MVMSVHPSWECGVQTCLQALHHLLTAFPLASCPITHHAFDSCHVCEQPKERSWSEHSLGEGFTASNCSSECRALNLSCEASWTMAHLMPEELTFLLYLGRQLDSNPRWG